MFNNLSIQEIDGKRFRGNVLSAAISLEQIDFALGMHLVPSLKSSRNVIK